MAANIKILGYLSHNNRQKPIAHAKNAIKYAEADREHHQNIPYLFGEEKEQSHDREGESLSKLEAMAKSLGVQVSYSASVIPKAELNFNNVITTTHSIHLKGMDQTLKSIELAHHMGYLLDIRDNFGNNAESWADAFQKDPLATERKAWMNAAKFLEKSGFSNWDRFSGHCQQNLSAIADDEKKVRECLQEIESHIPELSKMQMMAKEIEAEIKYAKITGGDGLIRMEGISAKPTVYVNADTSIDQKLIAIAHELGHAKDFRERFQSDIEQWIDKGEKNTLELEQKAWLNAVDLLKRSGFTNWDKFREEMRSGYKSYTDRRFSEEESEKEVNNFLKEVERYIPKPDRVDRREFFKRIEQQPRHGIVMHKWVISLSEDERDRLQIDMKQLARDFMNRLQMRYNIKLDWVAAIHDDKGHPHVHIAVRGWADGNKRQFAVYPTHIKEMRKILEEEKIRQAERKLGKEQARDILKEMEQEQEQQRIPFVPRRGGNRFLNSIIDQIIKSIQEDARRNEREIERQQMLEKQKLERERKQKESRSR